MHETEGEEGEGKDAIPESLEEVWRTVEDYETSPEEHQSIFSDSPSLPTVAIMR